MKLTGVLGALGSAMGARLGMAALNYGLFWELSHRLAADALGGFSLLMNISLLLQALPLLGLSVALIRRSATEPERLATEVSNAFAFALPVASLMGLGVFALGRADYPAALHVPFAWVALAMLPTAWVVVAECALIGQERVVDIARVQFVEALLRTVFCLLAVELGYGLGGVFVVFFAVRVCAAAVYALHRRLPLPSAALCSLALLRRNLREVPVFFGISLAVALGARLDLIVLSQLRALDEVGIYAAASRLYDAAQMIPTLTAMVMLPTLARLFKHEPARFRELLALALRLALGIGLALALAVAAFAQPVIDLLYKPEMAAAAPVLRWLIFGAVLMTLDQLLSSTMIAAQAQAQDLRSLGYALAVLAFGLLTLVPRFGPVGAAASVTLALAFRVAWRLRWARNALPLHGIGGDMARLLAAAAVGVAGLGFGLEVGSAQTAPAAALLAATVALLGYGLAARLLGVFGAHPWRQLRSGLARLTGT